MKLDMTVAGVTRRLDTDSILMSELRFLRRNTQYGSHIEFIDGLQADDPDALVFAWWLASKRAGEPIEGRFDEIDFDLADVQFAVTEEEGAAQAAAGPTSPPMSEEIPVAT